MLYDQMPAPEVDAESAHEFMKEATRLAGSAELEDASRLLARKSELFREMLSPAALSAISGDDLISLSRHSFGLGRKMRRLLQGRELPPLRTALGDLLHGPGEPGPRLEAFTAKIEGLPKPLATAWGSEMLHYTDPEANWLWTRWIWDERSGAGALPLVLQDGAELAGTGVAGRYAAVGKAIASVNERGRREGFTQMGNGLFGINVFLACVYTVYMYTVLQMKLSQEFNRILPELPEFTRRILGVQKLESA